MKTIYTVYRVCIKQTPSEDDPNGVFHIEIFGSHSDAVNYCNSYLNGTPVSIFPFGNDGIKLSVTDRDSVEQADGGVAYITLTPHEIEIDTYNIKHIL